MRKMKALISGVTALACIMAFGGVLWAAFPEKPIEYIICFNPGGQSDVTARVQQKDLEIRHAHASLAPSGNPDQRPIPKDVLPMCASFA